MCSQMLFTQFSCYHGLKKIPFEVPFGRDCERCIRQKAVNQCDEAVKRWIGEYLVRTQQLACRANAGLRSGIITNQMMRFDLNLEDPSLRTCPRSTTCTFLCSI